MQQALPALFIDHSTRKLGQMAGMIAACLTQLSDEQVWQRGGPNQNAIGNLVLHLCGNVGQWIGHTLGGAPDVRDRAAEFSTQGGYTAAELRELLGKTVQQARTIISALTEEQLAATVQTQDGPRSGLEVVYQVVGHLQQHGGQIVFATKQLTGRDLQFYRP
jgi:uncharacterized damage-inducible protein DinB